MPPSDGDRPSKSPTKTNADVPIDPSIAAASPTYSGAPYSPYTAQGHDMSQYQGQPPHAYPGWPGFGHHGLYSSPNASSAGGSPATTVPPRPGQVSSASDTKPYNPPNRTYQVYSFVPIPGAQQHKRPRRRYEEIERMYKCGYQGCEKAYGTLNHLNAHVTMQSHGQKRTPEGKRFIALIFAFSRASFNREILSPSFLRMPAKCGENSAVRPGDLAWFD